MTRRPWTSIVARLVRTRLVAGSIGGVVISLHWCWLPYVGMWAYFNRGRYTSSWWSAAEMLGAFGLVLAHEFGHAIGARLGGTSVREIVLWPLGGVAILAEAPMTRIRPKGEIVFVAGGPLVNLVLTPVLFGLWHAVGYARGGDISRLSWMVAWANANMVLFNLLPIWPLDGGQLMQSVLRGRVGWVRGRLLTGTLGLASAAAALAWAAHNHNFAGAGILVVLAAACTASAMPAVTRMRAERREGVNRDTRCAACGSHPLDAATERCDGCGEYCNPFRNDGRCWRCGTVIERIRCGCCGSVLPATEWEAART